MGLLNKLWQQWHHAKNDEVNEPLVVSGQTFNYAPHFINGERLVIDAKRYVDVKNPCTGQLERRISVAEDATVANAVRVAKDSLFLWSGTPYIERLRVIEYFKNAFALQRQALSEVLQQEGGLNDAEVKVEMELTNEAIIYALTASQFKSNAGSNWGDADAWIQHSVGPVGVVTVVCDERQTMKSLVSEVVVALLCGNTLLIKSHPCQPLLPVLLGDWLAQSGLPNGAYNVLQGDDEVTHMLHHHHDVDAISYVFIEPVTKQAHLRQRQTVLAQNFIVLDSHVDVDKVWSQFVAGPSVRLNMPIWMVIGNEADALLEKWQQYLQHQKAVVLSSEDGLKCCSGLLQQAVEMGADIVVDGSQMPLPEQGWYMGKSLIGNITPEMGLHQVLSNRLAVMVMRVPDLSAAVDVINQTHNVGGVSLFSSNITSMWHFKQSLHQAEVISFNRVELVPSLNLPRGEITHVLAVGGQHAARWQFYARHQLIVGSIH